MSMRKKELWNFLFSSYFEFLPEELEAELSDTRKKEIAMKCARRAYRDFNRTLRFTSKDQKLRENFRDTICEFIASEIPKLLQAGDEFDKRHKEICEAIITETIGWKENGKKLLKSPGKGKVAFSYGQAQKWLNMAIKYVWLLGLWADEFRAMQDKLHIPVDRYILKAASATKEQNLYGLALKCIPFKKKYKKGKYTCDKYSEEKTLPWSQWDYKAYIDFIGELQAKLKALGETPIEWENKAWIEQSKIESGKES